MDAEKVYSEIQKLPIMATQIRQREPEAISFLQRLYLNVTGSTVYAGCKGCHIKAANYLTSLTLNQLNTMAEQKFKLKKGNRIEWPYRSGQLITEGNLTDAKAAEMLLNHPSLISGFADYPTGNDGLLDLSEWYPETEEITEVEGKQVRKRKSNG